MSVLVSGVSGAAASGTAFGAVLPAVVGDTLLLVALTLLGALAGGRMLRGLAAQAAAAFVTGLGVLVVSGSIFLLIVAVTTAALSVWLMAALAALLASVAFGSRRGMAREVLPALAVALASAPVFFAFSALVRVQNAKAVLTDVIAFMASSGAIALGRSDLLLAEPTTFYSFPPGAKVTHALPFLYDPDGYSGLVSGEAGLRPLGLVLMLAVAVLMGTAVRTLTQGLPVWWSRTLAVAAPLALLSTDTAVSIALMNGSHAPVAAALLLLAVLLIELHRAPEGAATAGVRWAAGLMVAMVVLHRWEALLVVPLLLLPAYRLDVDRKVLAGLWQTLGLTLVAWSFAAFLPYQSAGAVVRWAGDPARTLTVMMAAGAIVYVAGTVSRSLSERVLAAAPALGVAGVWLGVAAYAVLDRGGLSRSLSATATNLLPLDGLAAGWWRWSGVAFLVVAAFVLAGRLWDRRPELGLFSYPALLFFPAMLIAAFVREGGYRVGFPDSLNRSWLHILPLLLVAVASATRSTLRPALPAQEGAEHER
jgi:hypothetical protein